MTKEKMLNLIDKLIKDEEEAIKNYNKAILELQDSPGITRDLGYIYSDETRHLTQLNELKLKVENYDPEKEKAKRLFSPTEAYHLGEDYYNAIVFTEEKEGE